MIENFLMSGPVRVTLPLFTGKKHIQTIKLNTDIKAKLKSLYKYYYHHDFSLSLKKRFPVFLQVSVQSHPLLSFTI